MQNRTCEDDDEEEEEAEEDTSCEMLEMCARRIQDCWRSHQNRKVFQLLMRTVCSAEACLTPALLQQLSPQEANLLRDPSLQCKVRFRFAGPLFPPVIVFKVFHTGRGGSYLSGKKLFQPSNQATADTCRMMGNRKFMDLMMEDENHWQGRTIWHPADVMCTRDYMQSPGRVTCMCGGERERVEVFISEATERWRRKGCGGRKGCGSDQQGLLQVPGCPTPSAVSSPGPRTPKRRSARAQAVAAHMRNIYRLQQEEKVKDRDEEVNASPRLGHMTDSQTMKHKDEKDDFIPDASTRLTLCDKIDCDWEDEAELLCSWSNQLSLDSI